ncbi:MAG: hypothetical protein WC992_05040 [Acholeplasmataceae bacterium]|jgi:hypothetical protein
MLKSKDFTLLDWIILFIVVPIPVVNIIVIVWLIYKIGIWQTLKKLLILLAIYLVSVFIGLMFLNGF